MKPLSIGDRIGRYTIEAELGLGGMGRVFRAHDELLRRKVALKILLAQTDDEEAIRRVVREARMAAALDHPNVVAIHDVGEHEGVPYIVLEYVVGQSVRSLIDSEAGVDERTRWLVDLARALAAAHKAGLVHRDVKPDNVMVRDDGVVKVLDFGIARRAAAGSQSADVEPASWEADLRTYVTRDGRVSGTPAYMAPEQLARGEGDERSEQFSWGVVAFEVFARRLPWRVPTAAGIVTQAVNDEPLDLGRGFAPENVEPAIRRALAWKLEDRFATMGALLAELPAPTVPPLDARGASGEGATTGPRTPPIAGDVSGDPTAPIDAPTERMPPPPSSVTVPAVRAKKKRTPRFVIAGFVLGAAVTFGVLALALRHTGVPRATPSGSAPPPSSQPTAITAVPPAWSFSMLRPLTTDEACEENPFFVDGGKSVVFDAADGSDYHVYRLEIATGKRTQITRGAGWQLVSSVSPDGKYIGFLRAGPVENVASETALDGSSERAFSKGSVRPTYSPDGTAVWCGSMEELTRVDRTTGEVQRRVKPPSGTYIRRLLELPDGHLVALVVDGTTHGKGLVAYPPNASQPTWLLEKPVKTFVVAKDHDSVLATARVGESARFDAWSVPLDGSQPAPVSGGVLPLEGGDLAPAGDQIVWSTCEARSDSFRLREDAHGEWIIPRPEKTVPWQEQSASAIPGTNQVVAVSGRDGQRSLWVVDFDGAPPRRIVTSERPAIDPAVSHDGKLVAYAEAQRGLFLVAIDGTSPPHKICDAGDASELAWTRDDGHIVYLSSEPSGVVMRIVPVRGGESIVLRGDATSPGARPGSDDILFVAVGPNASPGPLLGINPTTKATTVYVDSKLSSNTALAVRPDGKRATLWHDTELIELDLEHHRVARRALPGHDSFSGFAYTAGGPVAFRQVWAGDLWIANVAPR